LSLFKELKRRNVFKVAIAYAVIAWLLLQVGDTLAPALRLPEWVNSALAFFLLLGFPLALFFAWAFDLTPEGIKRDDEARQTGSEGAVTGRRFNIVIVGILAAIVVFVLYHKFVPDNGRGEPAAKQAEVGIVSIAVLPLAILNKDPEKEYLADGMTASLIMQLSKIEAFRVISRTSVQKYSDNTMSLPDIARELKVAAVVEGSVLSVGDKVRVNASLIPAEQDTAIWSQSYDRDMGDVLAMQSEISLAIAKQVQVALTAADKARLEPASPVDAKVQEMIMRGQFLFRQSDNSKGLDLLEQATVLAPDYAHGWAALAMAYYSLARNDPDFLGRARAAVARAMELEDSQSDAHYVAGAIAFYIDWDWGVATRELNRALDLNPGNGPALQALGDFYEVIGHWPKSIELGLRSIQSNPVSADLQMNLGLTYYYAGQYDKGLAAGLSAIELDPADAWSYICVAENQQGLGLLEEAVEAAGESIRLAPDSDMIAGLASFVFAAAGQSGKVEALHKSLQQESLTRYVSPFVLAATALNLGDEDMALTFLERAVEEKAIYTPWINTFPGLDRLRSNPRFQALIEKLHLPEVP